MKKKSYGHDSWRRENPEAVAQAIEQWTLDNGQEPNLGQKRSIASAAFKMLPTEEKDSWIEKAKASLEARNALAKLVNPNERAE